MSRSQNVLWTLSLVLGLMGANIACAQNFPQKPIRLVTTGIGGSSDLASRIIAQEISAPLGQAVIVENRAANILPESVAKAPPDGYTLMVTAGVLWTAPLLERTAYDPLKDFLPISLLVTQPNLLVVHPSMPVTSVRQLVALAKARPGELNYAATGIGGGSHLTAELFKVMAGVNIVGVFYRSVSDQVTALLSGEVQLNFSNVSSAIPLVKSGKLRALAVTSAEPTQLAPGIPTIAASGVPGFEAVAMTVMFAPAKTADAVIRRINQEVTRALTKPDVKDKFFSGGSEVVASAPERLAAVMKSDMARISKVIADAKIKVER
jgi:tripartite-type tricarboxylate transporter receptor subunit TctC